MSWEVVATESFSAEFRKFEKHKEFVDALDKKIEKLKEDHQYWCFSFWKTSWLQVYATRETFSDSISSFPSGSQNLLNRDRS